MTDTKKGRKLRISWSWTLKYWRLWIYTDCYYDGPWTQIDIGPMSIFYNKDGLPYLFQDKSNGEAAHR
jgi:hypothetical protein